MEHFEQKEGYRFYPTDSEGLKFLLRFVAKQEMHDAGFISTNIHVYGKEEPWEIYSQGVSDDDEDTSNYRYFITKKNNIYVGSWKQQDEGKPVHYNMHNSSSPMVIGCKKKMHYEHEDGHWIMKGYQLSTVILDKFDEDRRDYVLCAIKKKPGSSDPSTSTITMLNNVSGTS
ncbi:NAC domain-containing protein 78-like [Solanum dulcamara]|uniref:NAC domain-containing protein 78-like n=1 Tax=Solanum dulcamara TaxID=45834 RepID=UPI002485C291|nr:NAC domain-containing protein 78-like [Solanum dulcamara]